MAELALLVPNVYHRKSRFLDLNLCFHHPLYWQFLDLNLLFPHPPDPCMYPNPIPLSNPGPGGPHLRRLGRWGGRTRSSLLTQLNGYMENTAAGVRQLEEMLEHFGSICSPGGGLRVCASFFDNEMMRRIHPQRPKYLERPPILILMISACRGGLEWKGNGVPFSALGLDGLAWFG